MMRPRNISAREKARCSWMDTACICVTLRGLEKAYAADKCAPSKANVATACEE